MNSTSWQEAFLQPPVRNGGMPNRPPSSIEDTLQVNSSLLPTTAPCPDLQATILPNTDLLTSYEEPLLPCKDTKYFRDDLFNGICKENKVGMQNLLQCSSESRNEGTFPSNNYRVPSISFGSLSTNADPPSSSPFGILPHLAVKPSATVSRNPETFVSPVSNTVNNTGPYNSTEREPNGGTLHGNPLSNSSSISADTAIPSPVAHLSSSFSSPSNDYSTFSPQTATFSPPSFNKPVHSPMTPSPTVGHYSFPPSPFDSVGHIPPPCSPGNYSVHVRNGLHKHTSNNSSGVCYTPQPHVGPMHASDYHAESYHSNVYAPGRISPPYNSSGYSSMSHSSTRNSTDSLNSSPRGNSNFPHDTRCGHGLSVSSPPFLQNNLGHPGENHCRMQPPVYTPTTRARQNSATVATNNVVAEDPYAFSASEMIDDKSTIPVFNRHVEYKNRSSTPYGHYPDNDIQILKADSNQTLRPSNPIGSLSNQPIHYAKDHLVQSPMMYKTEPMQMDHQSTSYFNSGELNHFENNHTPRRRGGRRGRRRGGNTGCRGRGRGRGQSKGSDDKDYHHPSYARHKELYPYNYTQFKTEPEPFPVLSTSSMPATVLRSADANENRSANVLIRRVQNCPPRPTGAREIRIEFNNLFITLPLARRKRSLRGSVGNKPTKCMMDFMHYVRKRCDPPPCSVYPPALQSEPVIKKEKGGLILTFNRSSRRKQRWKCRQGTKDDPVTLTTDEEEEEEVKASIKKKKKKERRKRRKFEERQDFVLLTKNQIKQEVLSDTEESYTKTGNLGQVKGMSSAETKSNIDSVGHEPYQIITNSETLPAGKRKVAPESALNPEEQAHEAKMKVKNSKSDLCEDSNQSENSTLNGQDPANLKDSTSVINPTVTESEEGKGGLKLRSRNSVKTEPQPGPSTENDLVDFNSDPDRKGFNFSDSDEDPAWFPPEEKKASETGNDFGGTGKKRGRKSKGGGSARKKRRKSEPSPPPPEAPTPKQRKPRQAKQPKPAAPPVPPKETRSRGKKDTGTDRFLIAKADISLPTPFIWKVDRKSSMLQRFEISEQNGVLLYHSSFTYAAGNQFCVNNYATADVKVLSPDTVQYLGPNLSETAEVALSELNQRQAPENPPEENFDYLKEDFIVYIQCLLSQDVDSSFLHEIKKFNDEYFLIPIQNLEAISEVKKEKLLIEFWSEEFKKSIHTYPQFNILDSSIENITCKACERCQGSKMLQFYGKAYDPVTLEHVDSPLPAAKTEFSVCDNCSISISLYSRLHHQKYNLFVQCHSKASEVKSNNDDVHSHEDVLKLCLEDAAWIEKIFADQVETWKGCEKDS